MCSPFFTPYSLPTHLKKGKRLKSGLCVLERFFISFLFLNTTVTAKHPVYNIGIHNLNYINILCIQTLLMFCK